MGGDGLLHPLLERLIVILQPRIAPQQEIHPPDGGGHRLHGLPLRFLEQPQLTDADPAVLQRHHQGQQLVPVHHPIHGLLAAPICGVQLGTRPVNVIRHPAFQLIPQRIPRNNRGKRAHADHGQKSHRQKADEQLGTQLGPLEKSVNSYQHAASSLYRAGVIPV